MTEIQVVHTYDPMLFVGSVVLAAFGGYVALWLIDRVRSMEASERGLRWLAAASAAMGVGIWSMHFTGMLALRLPVPVGYEARLTLLSMAIAVVVSLLALAVVRQERVAAAQLAGASVLMGGAIAGMHYTGMAAMRLPGEMFYRPSLVVASVAVGVVASGAALWLFLRHRERGDPLGSLHGGKLVGGLVLGLAVSGLHYTGMAAARFRDLRTAAPIPGEGILLTESLALWVGLGSLVLLGLGLVAALVDRWLHLTYATELRESQRRYEILLTEISDTVTVLDEEGTIRYQSPSVEHLFGYEIGERKDRSAFEMVHPDDVDEVREAFSQSLSGDEGRTLQYRLRHADGSWRRVESTAVMPAEELGAMVVVTRDITDRVAAQQKYRAIFETTPSAVELSTLEEGRFIDVNRAFANLMGRSREEMVGSTADELEVWARPDQRDRVVGRLKEVGTVHNLEVEFRDAGGEVVDVLFSGSVLEFGEQPYLLGVAQDISERKEFEEALEHRALHDQLTGLPNRALFWDRLEHALERSRRTGNKIAVLFLDLDGFKRVNDEHGHGAGDEVLRRVADRLRSAVRDADTLARLGGDEFGVLLENVGEEPDAEEAARRLTDRFGPPVSVAGEGALVRVSCGIAFAGGEGEGETVTADELVHRADRAMYVAKTEPGSAFRAYGPELADGDRTGRLRREIEFKEALEDGGVVPFFQPIVDLEDGRVVGAEALARWVHPDRGLISPGEFIPLAEETGLIVDLGREMGRSAFAQLSTWEEEGLLPPDFRLHLNLSARELDRADIVGELDDLFREAGLEADRVAFDVTETVAVESAGTLGQIRGLGSPVAVDDFGTRYATLERLASLDLDSLKLDRVFVSRIGESDRHEAVLEASLTLADALGLLPVAEGVETERQRAWLTERGCRYGQGFLFGRAVSAEEFTGWLGSGQRLPA